MYGLKAEKAEEIKKKYKIQVAPYRELDSNFFKVCRGIFILKDSKAIHLYLYLCSCYNRKTEKVFPSYDAIQRSTGLNRNTISSKLKLLQKLKLIKIYKSKAMTGFNNYYTINYIVDIIEKNKINDNLEVEEFLDLEIDIELENVYIQLEENAGNISVPSEYQN